MMRSLLIVFLVLVSPLTLANYLERPEAQALIAELVSEYGLERADLESALASARHVASVIEAISRPAERRLRWYEYRKIFLQPLRIGRGVDFWRRNAETLWRAESEFGVDPRVIVAIIGVETDYGRVMGSYKALDALSTLAFDYPPRADFFRKELGQLLVLAQEEGKAVQSFMGSYAGALGMGQFIPSSFRAYAIDFTEDGIRDIWTSEVDAIGSVANYLSVHGWRHRDPVILPVALAANASQPVQVVTEISSAPSRAQLEAKGILFEDSTWQGVDSGEPVMLTSFEFKRGIEHFGGLMNFYVITRYNRSHMYALAVHRLAEQVERGYQRLYGED